MREIHLLDDDDSLFHATLNRTLYNCYRNNIKVFNAMLTDQGDAYWIKFCSTLRYVLEKEGYGVKIMKKNVNHFDNFFRSLLMLLSDSEKERVQTLVNDVVCMGRFSQLFKGAKIYESYSQKDSESFKRLFKPDTCQPDIKLWLTLPLYLRAIGSLLKIFQLWLTAPPTDNVDWKFPDSWEVNLMNEPSYGLFEHYLKKTWGDNLLTLLGSGLKYVSWWSDKNIAAIEDAKPELIYMERSSHLGKLITDVIEDNDDSFSMAVGFGLFDDVALKNFHSYQFLRDCLRGGHLFLCREQYRIAFLCANSREMYLPDCKSVFHPCSQFAMAFWNLTFGPRFWTAKNGAEDAIKEWQNFVKTRLQFKKPHKPSDVFKRSSLQVGRIGLAMVTLYEAKMAIYLDSRFHDTLVNSTTWESPEAQIRLMWNMPFCLNWLEMVLLQIYEFETVFVPFVHFPLNKTVKALAEELYVKYCRGARFLVKAAIIIADYIYVKEEESAGRCYEERMGLKFSIEMLIPMMCFLNGPAYQILELILRETYTEEEMAEGQIYEEDVHRVYLDLSSACTIPYLDKIFYQNHRCVNYWMSKEKYPPVKETRTLYSRAVKALQIFERFLKDKDKVKIERDVACEPLFSYDKELFRRACSEVFRFKDVKPLNRAVSFVHAMFELLGEDGWVCEREEEEFWKVLSGGLKDVHEILDNMLDFNEETKKVVLELEYLGEVYLLGACLLGDTWDVKLPEQNLLTKILTAECRSAMADVAGRFAVVSSRSHSSEHPCPANRFFVDAYSKIESLKVEKMSLEEAKNKLKHPLNCNYVSDLPPLIVPNVKTNSEENMQPYYDFLKNLNGMRNRLLHEISEQQWKYCKLYSAKEGPMNNVSFRNMNLLEYRLIEEMAALQKCADIGPEQKGAANRLILLLRLRAMSLVKQYKAWCKVEITPGPSMIPLSAAEVLQVSIVNRVRTTALLIPLRSIFTVYLSNFSTVHPIFQGTIDLMVEWQDFLLRLFKRPESDILMAENLTEFCEAVRYMAVEYMNGLLDHCMKAWNVPRLCSNPTEIVEKYSPLHAQKIHSCLLHLSLICAYNALLAPDTRPTGLAFLSNLSKQFISSEVIIRKATRIATTSWGESRAALQQIFKSMYKALGLIIKGLKRKADKMPHWRGYDNAFLILFTDLAEANGIDPLDCLDINDFCNKDFGIQLKPIDLEKLKGTYRGDKTDTAYGKTKLSEKLRISKAVQHGKVALMEKAESSGKTIANKKCSKLNDITKSNHLEVKKTTDVCVEKHGNKTWLIEKTVIRSKRIMNESDKKAMEEKAKEEKAKEEKAKEAAAAVDKISNVVDEIPGASKEVKNRLRRKAKRDRYKLNKQKNSIDKLTSVIQSNRERAKYSKDYDSSPTESVKDETFDKGNGSNYENMSEKQKHVNISQRKLNQLQNEKKQNQPQDDKKQNQPQNDKKQNQLQSDKKQNQPQNDKIQNQPQNGKKQNQPQNDKKQNQPQNDKKQETKESDDKKGKNTESATTQKSQGSTEKNGQKNGNTAVKAHEEKNVVNGHDQTLRHCFQCGAAEKVFRAYKKCGLCTDRQWTVVRFYCSNECQGTAWRERHCVEHQHCDDPTDIIRTIKR